MAFFAFLCVVEVECQASHLVSLGWQLVVGCTQLKPSLEVQVGVAATEGPQLRAH